MELSKIGLAFLAVAVIFLVGRMRRRNKDRPEPGRGNLRVVGSHLTARLHPRMGRGCVAQHGLQFGRGFRVKEAPALPHHGQCACETAPFNFSSAEVFGGALRELGGVQSDVPEIQGEDALNVLNAIRQAETEPLPDSLDAYVALVGTPVMDAEAVRGLSALLVERHAYLLAEEPEIWREPPAQEDEEGGNEAPEWGSAHPRADPPPSE